MRVLIASFLFLFSTVTFSAPSIIPKPPSLAASSYILMDANSGEVLVEHNADKVLPPASLTKLMTAFIAFEELSYGNIALDEKVRVSVKAWKAEGSRMFIREGTTVPVEDLLRGIIIQSGNDASIAMAEHISGTESSFADIMNQYAVSLGMTNSQFKNATGLPSEGHHSSARDMATLARAIIFNHKQHYPIYSEKKFKYNNIEQTNRNRLLFWNDKVDGLKTGHTEEAGYCLVSSAQDEDMRLIAVVMGANSERARARESNKLLTYGFRYFESHRLYESKESLQTTDVWLGQQETLNLGVKEGAYITIPRGQKGNLDVEFTIDEVIKAPVLEGMEFGRIKVSLDDKVLMDKPLIALENIEEAGFFARIWDYIKLFFYSLFS
ncbi:D-alanyl-D-alanine carboxypeptidase [Bermanella marisrubri]|uniref:serine-type D-Ala-D-Ala carboxypeptidase n=1 Tax=Bermanella marisrubri TaxID=207949 RepID=Q1N084_9GAMM|nr:D-alanyl-D-alanine carboxypeptidase family protein [Bermanella marisrubri]EAT11633.1 D-alanyl-D-alanine carboxypeptidase [Oceanobacter sp. RED65] [Bermanella marisrubri]QIZ83325.1 D-alanyl-D-alanine carboxypeptidase [Bermanella marisrubri]